MVAGTATVQDVLDAIAEECADITGIESSFSNGPELIKELPAVVAEWFSDTDATIEHGSTQYWIVPVRVRLFTKAIKGNNPVPDVTRTNNLIMEIVDTVSQNPSLFDANSKMMEVYSNGVHHIHVNRVRPAQFGLEYAGHRYFGAELFIEIKLHRMIEA